MPPLACVELRPYKFVGEGSLPVSKPVVYHDGGLSLPLLPNGTVNNNNSVANGWSVERSSALYGVQGWGAPYFVINDNGNVAVRPHGSQSLVSEEIDLTKVVKKVVDSKHLGGLGMSPPLIIRLPDVLRHRIESLQGAFDSAIGLQDYGSHFQGVYPVKSNQDRYVVENIVEFGSRFGFGLEAGSKPELLLAMSCLCKGSPRAFLVCNGYKDEEYVSLALISRRLDFNTVIVLEQEEELDVVMNASRRLSIRPVVGLRAKLRTKHGGHFGGTSGEKGKFGLTTPEIVSVVRKLQRAGMLDCLQLLHFHIGSQIPSVDLLRDGVGEAAHIYCELVKLGANMRIFDIGGGLGIDYDGSKSGCSDMSVGYSLEEYATAVVASVQAACDQKGVEHPVLCSESGRALVSHHSVLIFDVVSVQERSADAKQKLFDWGLFADDMEGLPEEILGDYHKLLASASMGDYGSSLAYAERMKASCVDLFKCGRLGLESLAMIDGFCDILSTVVAEGDGRSPVAINGGGASAVCHINLSIFKSIPDFWAIGQLFPIMPIQRLNEQPKVRAVLSDLTCDSDGKVETFIGMGGEQGGKSHCLMMHSVEGAPNGSNPYYLGLFLGGAYQEALGGLHNLFGNPNVVHVVQSSGPHCFAITRALPGQTSADVLRLMMHEPHMMFHFLKCRIEDNLLQERGYGDGYEESVSSILKNIASAFDSLPYLSPSASSSDDDDDEEDDEEQWMSCSASLMDCSLNQRYC